jgi:hypothetical protein
MTPQVFLVTNAHAGLGLELCRALLAKDLETVVIAAVPALAGDDELAGMERRQPSRLERIQMDGASSPSLKNQLRTSTDWLGSLCAGYIRRRETRKAWQPPPRRARTCASPGGESTWSVHTQNLR